MCTRNKIWHVKAELKKDLLAKKYLKLKRRCSTTKKKVGVGGCIWGIICFLQESYRLYT